MPMDQPGPSPISTPDPRPEPGPEPPRMPLGDHLEELRRRIILALIGPVVASAFTLYFGKEIVAWLIKPGLSVLVALGQPPYFLALGATTGFAVYIKVSLVAGAALTFPWMAYQLWKFVESGLYSHERKAMLVVAPFSAVMSVLAVLFLYYLLLPICLAFLLFFTATMPAPDLTPPSQDSLLQRLTGMTIRASGLDEGGPGSPDLHIDDRPDPNAKPTHLPVLTTEPSNPRDGTVWFNAPSGELHAAVGGRVLRFSPVGGGPVLRPNLDINQYIGFVTLMGVGVLVAFQLPVVMLILGWANIVDPRWLKKYRKYCVFACFVMGAVFTPADPVSMMVLALPLWGLFEFGIGLMYLSYTPVPDEL